MPVSLQTILLLVASNIFMTFAGYGHLKGLAMSPWYIAALISWGIVRFEFEEPDRTPRRAQRAVAQALGAHG